MKRQYVIIPVILAIFAIHSCVQDYKDANPPRLKDSPAVASVTIQDDLIFDGSSTKITINVVDAPAGIDSVGYNAIDENGDPVGDMTFDNLSSLIGQTKGEIIATYTSEAGKAALVTITVIVYDKQMSEGEVVRKSSEPQSVVVEIVCASDLAGVYTTSTSGSSTDGGANMNPVENLPSEVTLEATEVPGQYTISDASAGIYDAWYLGVYYDAPTALPGLLKDACGNISVTEFESPFSGDGPDVSYGTVDNGIITVTVVNVYGDEWTITMTPK
jgi:hypothetical protein